MVEPQLPRYADLPKADGGARSGWHLFGADDQVGLMNLQTPERIAAAAALVHSGEVYPLGATLGQPDPPLFGRGAPRRTQLEPRESWYFDDVHDNLFPQAGSQWDALGHIGFREGEFYNGATADDIRGGRRNTIEHWARRGIVGRGILLDLQATAPEAYDPASSKAFSVDDLERARIAAGVEYQPGDIVMLRTGFLEHNVTSDVASRKSQSVRTTLKAPGIEHTEEMAEYVWNTHASAFVGDNPTVEVWPPDERPEAWPFGYLHYMLIGQFGLGLGELWWLKDLADACTADGRHEFFVSSAPTDAPGAVGSMANAIAIR
ncbi:cyclase family protein [Herbiconiux sp. CPCC 203407]|uniref:Cyclase family protein n=1 Tax=Herbiconiux oxytropis TaxID=2970915 RepID=A0AA42BVM9_9MICO|nr:cyclase family protein [Herbiconiux oxytropis]MCS5721694.1 cyclase family protein [Herbiconiux oxytropis]MCS5726679.1 cyclase family protein [Herbiconiux oxytropis]